MNIFSRKKVTKKDVVLELLLNHGEMSPLEIIAASKGELKRGTVYNILNRLEFDGYLETRDGEGSTKVGKLPQRFYKVSRNGQRVINAHRYNDIPRLDTLAVV